MSPHADVPAPPQGGRGMGLFAAMAGSVLGAGLQLRQPALWPWMAYAALLLVAVAGTLALSRWGPRLRHGVLCVALLLGALSGAGLAGWRAAAYTADALAPELEGRDLQLVGVIARMPQRDAGVVRFVFEVESARWTGSQAAGKGIDERTKSTESTEEGGEPRVPHRISLSWYAGDGWRRATLGEAAPPSASPGPLHAGERWRLTARLKAPHGSLNPHGFDLELWAWERGVQATGYVRTGARDVPPERLEATWRHPVERARESVRDAILERVAEARAAGVIAALVTGDQNAIERVDWDVFRATGVAHLMAISGLHVTMFAWLAMQLVGALWRRSGRLTLRWPAPHAALVIGVLLATLYAVFSGWGVPSRRTVWMLAVVAGLRLTGRRWPWPHAWLCTCAVVVAFDPWALMQAGFWLSFVAVGVLFAAGGSLPDARRTRLAARIAQMCREQWVVTLALTPLCLLLFQQVSVVGFVANAVAIPWVTLLVTPLAMLGVALAPLWDVAGWAVQALVFLLEWMAGLSFATVSMPAPAPWAVVAGVVGGVLLAMRLPWGMRMLGIPLVLPALLWQAPRPPPGEFELLAADVGQGNAVLVRTAGHSLLYDAGPRHGIDSDAGQRVLVPLLRAFGERLDTVMLSHRDSDHTGGAPAVLEMHPQARLHSSIEAAHPLQALRPAQRCEAGQRWTWDGVAFEVLHPVPADYTATAKPNAISCVLRIDNGRVAALLAGDIERAQEAALVARTSPQALRADVLLVPHHGSRTSSSDRFLDAVAPRIALVQAGYRNRFGHPAPVVVARYQARGIALFDSARCGAASWSSRAADDLQCERERSRRYWHHRSE